MKRKHIIVAILALALFGALVYFYSGSRVPPGQQPLRSLTAQNLPEIKDSFNAAKNDIRVLMLLSPT